MHIAGASASRDRGAARMAPTAPTNCHHVQPLSQYHRAMNLPSILLYNTHTTYATYAPGFRPARWLTISSALSNQSEILPPAVAMLRRPPQFLTSPTTPTTRRRFGTLYCETRGEGGEAKTSTYQAISCSTTREHIGIRLSVWYKANAASTYVLREFYALYNTCRFSLLAALASPRNLSSGLKAARA